jgi:CHAT domain-containing protein
LATVGDSFELKYPDGSLKKLRRHMATEDTLREEASQHRWLHLATHGFFAPPDKHSALAPVDHASRGGSSSVSRGAAAIGSAGVAGYHPGVLSGVVLAGANNPSATDAYDGIITALEIAELDLSDVEVVVLSACETGLGKVAGGEGVLGIQRAFQLAGANTVVTSFWPVDDTATQQLMVHFYTQLWESKEGKIGKLEAFRNSQLEMLRKGRSRGWTEEEDDTPKQDPRTPPFYWAAFSISGDWR